MIGPVGLLHVVRGQKDGHSGALTKAENDLPDVLARLGIESGGRLVQKQQAGSIQKPPGNVGPALLPARELAERPVENLLQVEQLVQLLQPRAQGFPPQTVIAGTHGQILPDGQPLVQHGVLKHDAELGLDFIRLPLEVAPVNQNAARILLQNRAQDVDGRTLPRAVQAEKGKQAAPLDRKADVVHRLNRPKALGQTGYFNDIIQC